MFKALIENPKNLEILISKKNKILRKINISKQK